MTLRWTNLPTCKLVGEVGTNSVYYKVKLRQKSIIRKPGIIAFLGSRKAVIEKSE